MAQYFEPTFASLRTSQAPDWFRDAKFGIWAHWGPQSVPMFGDWYARNMYIEGTPQYEYHLRHYGHPSKFGYKDICALWKAENFDPAGLMDLYYKAGARYFVAQAMHHDHFFNYDSAVNRMNSVNVGPHRDILAAWKKEADRYSLPFGVTEHLGASFNWWRVNKGADKYGPYAGVPYDGNDPAYRDFYHDNYAAMTGDWKEARPWYTDDPAFRDYWKRAMFELIDKYQPDLLYSDGSLPFGSHWQGNEGQPINESEYREGLEAVAKLYNSSIDRFGKNNAVYLQKDRRPEIYKVGLLDMEKSQLPEISPDPWHTDTCIGNWFYDVHYPYKHPDQIIEMLIDICAKNGTMLLNILQRPDGTIDDEARYILSELAGWFSVAEEGIRGTRPWQVYGEGTTFVKIQGFTEEKTNWQAGDIRYVQKDGRIYAWLMGGRPGTVITIRALSERRVQSVRLLGGEALPFEQPFGVLTVKLPEVLPTKYTNCLVIEA